MIIGFNPNTKSILIQCDKCGRESEKEIIQTGLQFLEEFQQYENYPLVPCETCGTSECLNMNLPDVEDMSDMPESERIIRSLVKGITKYVMKKSSMIEFL